jgi:hypothetical protein
MDHLDFTQQDALLDFTAAYLDPNAADPRQQSYPTFHYPNQPHAAWQQQLSLEAAMDNEGLSHPQHHHSHSHSHSHSMLSQQQQQGQQQQHQQHQLQQQHHVTTNITNISSNTCPRPRLLQVSTAR